MRSQPACRRTKFFKMSLSAHDNVKNVERQRYQNTFTVYNSNFLPQCPSKEYMYIVYIRFKDFPAHRTYAKVANFK